MSPHSLSFHLWKSSPYLIPENGLCWKNLCLLWYTTSRKASWWEIHVLWVSFPEYHASDLTITSSLGVYNKIFWLPHLSFWPNWTKLTKAWYKSILKEWKKKGMIVEIDILKDINRAGKAVCFEIVCKMQKKSSSLTFSVYCWYVGPVEVSDDIQKSPSLELVRWHDSQECLRQLLVTQIQAGGWVANLGDVEQGQEVLDLDCNGTGSRTDEACDWLFTLFGTSRAWTGQSDWWTPDLQWSFWWSQWSAPGQLGSTSRNPGCHIRGWHSEGYPDCCWFHQEFWRNISIRCIPYCSQNSPHWLVKAIFNGGCRCTGKSAPIMMSPSIRIILRFVTWAFGVPVSEEPLANNQVPQRWQQWWVSMATGVKTLATVWT